MSYPELLKRFYRMETEAGLFGIRDGKGVYVWDLLRFYVFTALLWTDEVAKKDAPNITPRELLSMIPSLVRNLWIILTVRKKYFFFLNSRNRLPESGLYFDQSAFDTLSLLPPEDCLIDELYPTGGRDDYGKIVTFSSSELLLRLMTPGVPDYDFTQIKSVIDRYFEDNRVSLRRLRSEYRKYYRGKRFYGLIFRTTSPRLLFVTQAGMQKGMFAAARELSIPIVEFNHGIVYDGHMAYSYPRTEGIHNYNADCIFSLSDFWFRDMYLPHTALITVGNSFFPPKDVAERSPETDRRVLVVSSNEMGMALKDFLLEMFGRRPESLGYSYWFKLHPNQLGQEDEYRKFFADYPNVRVITDGKSVQGCMQECSTMLAIQSTAVFEALQMGRKVLILKKSSYEVMQVVFGERNVSLIDTPDDFIEAMRTPFQNCGTEYFAPFDPVRAKEAIEKILENGRA